MKQEIELARPATDVKLRPYEHHAKYYETDQMGIIHHSNYVKWMEEARGSDGSDGTKLQADGRNGDYQSGTLDFSKLSQYGSF